MPNNENPRATGEAVADVLQSYANWYHDHVSRGGWTNGSHVENKRSCEAARIVEMFAPHPAPRRRVVVTEVSEGVPEYVNNALASLAKAWPVLAQHADHMDGEFSNALDTVKRYVERAPAPAPRRARRMRSRDEVLREFGYCFWCKAGICSGDDNKQASYKMAARILELETALADAQRERDALKAMAGVVEAGDGLLAVATELRRLHERAGSAEARATRAEQQVAEMAALLDTFYEDAQTTLDQYDKNGPTWTSRDSGQEYYDASYVIEKARERIAVIDTHRAAQPGQANIGATAPQPTRGLSGTTTENIMSNVTHLPHPGITLSVATPAEAMAAATGLAEQIGALPADAAVKNALLAVVSTFETAATTLANANGPAGDAVRYSGYLRGFTNGAGTVQVELSLSAFPAVGAAPVDATPDDAEIAPAEEATGA
jgi:hypothetical protein